MAEIGKALEIPVNTASLALNTAARGGRLALGAGRSLAREVIDPYYVSPETQGKQDVLREHPHIAVVDLVDPGASRDELETRASSTADGLVSGGVIREGATVEVLPMMPGDALRHPDPDNLQVPGMQQEAEDAVGIMGRALMDRGDGLGIDVRPEPAPLIPSDGVDETVSPARLWGTMAEEVDLLHHEVQLSGEPEDPIAVVTVTSTEYARTFFGPQVPELPGPSKFGFLVLDKIGIKPEDNFLGRRFHKLQSGELPPLHGFQREEDGFEDSPSGLLMRAVRQGFRRTILV